MVVNCVFKGLKLLGWTFSDLLIDFQIIWGSAWKNKVLLCASLVIFQKGAFFLSLFYVYIILFYILDLVWNDLTLIIQLINFITIPFFFPQ